MIIEPCHCNHGIRGVDSLPGHYHPWSPGDTYVSAPLIESDGMRTLRRVHDPDQEPHFLVDWREVSRAVAA